MPFKLIPAGLVISEVGIYLELVNLDSSIKVKYSFKSSKENSFALYLVGSGKE